MGRGEKTDFLLPPSGGDGNLGVMGTGSLWEAGEERAGDRIAKGAGVEGNRK